MGVTDLNRHGGVGGCPVQLVWYDFKVESANTSYDQEAQDECTAFSQDAHVFAAAPQVHEGWVFASCMMQHHLPVIEGTPSESIPTTSSDFASGLLFSPSQIALDRLGGEIDLFKSAGYFDPGSRVGILITDDGRGISKHIVNDVWKPRLAALHIPVVATYTAPRINGFAQLTEAGQQMGNAVLQFQQARVNHVLLAPLAGEDFFFFATAAQNQRYYPRIATDTSNRPETSGSGTEANSLKNAIAVSWELTDVDDQAQHPSTPSTAARDRCRALYQNAAAAVGVAVETLYAWCDTLNLLKTALGGSAGHPTLGAFQHGVAALGSSFSLASGYGNGRFAGNRGDGGQLIRMMEFDQSTNSWKYVSGVQAMS